MKQNSKILAAYVKICTHFCFVAFIEKHGAKDLFILARKLGENLLHYFLVLFRRERYLRIGASIGRIRSIAFIVNGNIGPRPEIFEKDVVANRVHEGAKPFRVLQTLLAAKGYEYPEKRFLPNVFDHVCRQTPRSQLDEDEITEVRSEVPLNFRFAFRQIANVFLVKGVKIQTIPRREC